MTLRPLAGTRPVVWVLATTTHYHNARMAAFSDKWRDGACVVELTNTDAVRVLETNSENSAYSRHTLCAGVPTDRVGSLSVWPQLRNTLNQLKPCVVCINGWSGGGAPETLRWCLQNRVGAVVMSESTAADARRIWFRERLKRHVLTLYSSALVGGAPHRAYLETLGFPQERIFDGYDVVDNGYFLRGATAARSDQAALRRRLALPARYFVAASRFGQKKNLPRVLQAYAQYRSLAGDEAWDFVLLGDGDLRHDLVRLATELGVERSFRMPGFASYADLPAYYSLASCFVHASTTEQWGLVVNEAMASGLPVLLSNRCGCCADLLQEGVNGYSFDPYDPGLLAGLMWKCHLRGHALFEMGKASAAIVQDWGPDRFAENLVRAAELALSAEPQRQSVVDRTVLAALSLA